jgi:uncharacterized protein YrrD
VEGGAPISWKVLEAGAPVGSRDGEDVGTVTHVLGDPDADIFDGLVIRAGGGHRFVDATQVDEIHEDRVVLTLDAADCERLPEPTENPAEMSADPADTDPRAGEELRRKLQRAWDLISGRY